MRAWRVAVVGGGPGGLLTSYFLQNAADTPVRITLFEASSRLGGKILTPEFTSARVRYEAGAAEFYDYSMFEDDPLKDLIEELGLPIAPMGGAAVIMNNHLLANLDDIRDRFGTDACRELVAFDKAAKDRITPREFYHSDYPDGVSGTTDLRRFDTLLDTVRAPDARHYVETAIHSDLATEPRHTSLSYGLQNYLMNDPAYMLLYGIEGGNERLPREIAARIQADFRMEHRVSHIERVEGGQLRVRSVTATTTHEDDFDFVVVALPHSALESVTFTGDRLRTAIESHRNDYDFPAHYLRITILFRTPFWRTVLNDSFWMLDRFGGCCLYDESSREPGARYGVLGWLLGGQAAVDHSSLSDEQLIREALDSLPEFLTGGREEFLEGRVHRWTGAVNAIPGGIRPVCLDRRHQPDPVEHPNLFLVGDYLYDSTLNGVLDSAEYVSDWIAALTASS